MAPLTRADLDTQQCSTPGCNCSDHLYFHGRCHPGSVVDAYYKDGIITFECGQCEKVVAQVAVKEAPDGSQPER